MEFTVYRNIEYAYRLIGKEISREEIIEVLKKVNLENEIDQTIDQLSEGQKQRLAIICALSKSPRILILDEPTSALDEENAIIIMKLIQELAKKRHTIIVTSHQLFAKEYADQIYRIEDQKLIVEKTCNDEKINQKLTNRLTFSLDTYLYYLKSFYARYKKQTFYILSVITFVLLLFLGTISFHDYLFSKGINKYENLNRNEILLNVENREGLYDELKSDQRIYNVYPYYKIKMNVGSSVSIDVLPMFPENNYSSFYKVNLRIKDQLGNYVSDSIYGILSWYNIQSIPAILYFNDIKVNTIISVDGAYNEYIENPINEGKSFIYLYYDTINEIIESNHLDIEPDGYIVFLKDVSTANKLKKDYQCLSINKQFGKIGTIGQIYDVYSNYRSITIKILIIVLAALLGIVNFNYLNKRKEEFSIMKINGLKNKDILSMLFIECTMNIVSSAIISLILFIIGYSIMKWIGIISISLSVIDLFKLIVLLCGIVYLFYIVIDLVFIFFLNVEKTLRN